MKKPMSTYPSGIKSRKVGKVPSNAENFKPEAGGKINPYGADMAGDTKVRRPQEMKDGHVKTSIHPTDVFGETVDGISKIHPTSLGNPNSFKIPGSGKKPKG